MTSARRERARAFSNRGLDRFGNRDRNGAVAHPVELAAGTQETDDFAQVQRVPLGGRGDDVNRFRRHGAANDPLQVLGGVFECEPLQAKDARFAGHLEQQSLGIAQMSLRHSVGPDHHHTHGSNLTLEKVEQQDRRRIGRMEIFEGQDDGRAL
jgi:hypothetical protein